MELAGATGRDRMVLGLERALAARREAGATMFGRESLRIARCCHRMAQRFATGGRLISLGADPAARSDARHVSVEFVHPVIVGKRALPATALTGEGGPLVAQLEALVGRDDIVIGFGLDAGGAAAGETATALAAAADHGCMTIAFGPGGRADGEAHWLFEPPSADPAIRQELVETLYHVLWELVHVFFEHRGLLTKPGDRPLDRSPAGFLYPFLEGGDADLDAVLADVSDSVQMKSEEVGELRAQTLRENATELVSAAERVRACFEAGGRVLAFGNGGSATDAMDLVADLRLPGVPGWRPRPALDLTEDTGIITAVANDVGVAEIFQRQLIASGREGDVAVAFSTSGGSENLVEGLAEARRRGIGTVAFVGYDGGRIAAEGLADAVIISRSQHIPRIQEAQASAYHLLRELVETADVGRARE